MKLLVCLLPLLLATLGAHADYWLQNGDFTGGSDHWYGDAKWPSDFAASDPFAKPDPFTSKGMIIQLKSQSWVKVFQDFSGKGKNAVLKVSYAMSPDLAFSHDAKDYQNMPDKIGWDAWKAFNTPINTWVIFISELSSRKGQYRLIEPHFGSNQEQTVITPLKDLNPGSDKTMALAFPPGTGTLVIHKIEIDDQ